MCAAYCVAAAKRNVFTGGSDDRVEKASFTLCFCDRLSSSASARHLREQGRRKRRPRACRRGTDGLPGEMQARRVRAEGNRIGRQAAQGRRENKLHGKVPEGASLSNRIALTCAIRVPGDWRSRTRSCG